VGWRRKLAARKKLIDTKKNDEYIDEEQDKNPVSSVLESLLAAEAGAASLPIGCRV
jgi:hypothetical protein